MGKWCSGHCAGHVGDESVVKSGEIWGKIKRGDLISRWHGKSDHHRNTHSTNPTWHFRYRFMSCSNQMVEPSKLRNMNSLSDRIVPKMCTNVRVSKVLAVMSKTFDTKRAAVRAHSIQSFECENLLHPLNHHKNRRPRLCHSSHVLRSPSA